MALISPFSSLRIAVAMMVGDVAIDNMTTICKMMLWTLSNSPRRIMKRFCASPSFCLFVCGSDKSYFELQTSCNAVGRVMPEADRRYCIAETDKQVMPTDFLTWFVNIFELRLIKFFFEFSRWRKNFKRALKAESLSRLFFENESSSLRFFVNYSTFDVVMESFEDTTTDVDPSVVYVRTLYHYYHIYNIIMLFSAMVGPLF